MGPINYGLIPGRITIIRSLTPHSPKWPMAWLILLVLAICSPVWGANPTGLYKRHVDPAGRYTLEYPATMDARFNGPDELVISHPKAPFRIYLIIVDRRKGNPPDARELLKAMAKQLEKEVGRIRILDAKAPINGDKRQGYAIFQFKNSRGVDLTQLAHCYAAKNKVLQLIISDRSKGYENIKPVVEKVHKSLKILSEDLE